MTGVGPGALRPPNVWPDSLPTYGCGRKQNPLVREQRSSKGLLRPRGTDSAIASKVPSASECRLPWNDAHRGSPPSLPGHSVLGTTLELQAADHSEPLALGFPSLTCSSSDWSVLF